MKPIIICPSLTNDLKRPLSPAESEEFDRWSKRCDEIELFENWQRDFWREICLTDKS